MRPLYHIVSIRIMDVFTASRGFYYYSPQSAPFTTHRPYVPGSSVKVVAGPTRWSHFFLDIEPLTILKKVLFQFKIKFPHNNLSIHLTNRNPIAHYSCGVCKKSRYELVYILLYYIYIDYIFMYNILALPAIELHPAKDILCKTVYWQKVGYLFEMNKQIACRWCYVI